MPARRASKPAPRAPDLQHEIGKKKPFDVPEEEAFLNLLRTCSIFTTETGRFFRDYGLTEAQYNALRILRGHAQRVRENRSDVGPDGVPSQTIGEQLVAQVPDVTRLVDRLVDAGLAERARTEEDRRLVIVRITREGLDLLARIDRPILELHRRQLGHMTRADLAELNRLLVLARRGSEGSDPVTDRCPR
ncbi:MAG: MarR family transcriptional regulator [Phycisphaerales bacterium]|nr:MarR family transcriptional regulator [Phycisphaerales bacterium]